MQSWAGACWFSYAKCVSGRVLVHCSYAKYISRLAGHVLFRDPTPLEPNAAARSTVPWKALAWQPLCTTISQISGTGPGVYYFFSLQSVLGSCLPVVAGFPCQSPLSNRCFKPSNSWSCKRPASRSAWSSLSSFTHSATARRLLGSGPALPAAGASGG